MKDVIQRHRAHRKGDISCSTFDIKMASKHLNALLVSKLNCVHVMPVELRPGSSTLLHIEHIIIFIIILYLFYFRAIPPGIARHQYNIGLQYIHLPVILHGANLIGRTNFKRAKLSVSPPPPPIFLTLHPRPVSLASSLAVFSSSLCPDFTASETPAVAVLFSSHRN